MTIGKTGNRIVDQLARNKARSQAEERKAKASAKKSARGARGGKFRGAAKVGRAAARRPAKGISAKYIGKAGSAGKTVKYGLKEGAELIDSNCGFDIPTIAHGLAPRLRPDIQKQIVRMSFSTPSTSGKASANEWRDRVDYIRQQLGIDDSYSFCASRHTDAEHDHIHLDFNRISDTGQVWRDSLIGLRLAKLEQRIEEKFSLKLTKREDFLTHGNLNKKAVEQAQRIQEQPAFIVIQTAIMEAAKNTPDVLTFVQRMADRGIAVRPNLKLNELNGFGYQYGKHKFTGKQLGMNWMELRKRIVYEPNEHIEILADIKREIDAGVERPFIQELAASAQFGSGEEEPAKMGGRSQKGAVENKVSRSPAAKIEGRERESDGPSVRPSAIELLAGLRHRMDERRARFLSLAERIKAESKADQLAARFCAALDPSMTDIEVAEAFLKQEGGAFSARMMIRNLALSDQEMKALLQPYREMIEVEAQNRKRLDNAVHGAPTPSSVDADLDAQSPESWLGVFEPPPP